MILCACSKVNFCLRRPIQTCYVRFDTMESSFSSYFSGTSNATVTMNTLQKSLLYNLTAHEPTCISINPEGIIIIQADSNILIFVEDINLNSSYYFARPTDFFSVATREEWEQELIKVVIPSNSETVVFICCDKNVTVSSNNSTLNVLYINTVEVFENQLSYLLHFAAEGKQFMHLTYPISKCSLIRQDQVNSIDTFYKGTMKNNSRGTFDNVSAIHLHYNDIIMNKTVLNEEPVIKLNAVLSDGNDTHTNLVEIQARMHVSESRKGEHDTQSNNSGVLSPGSKNHLVNKVNDVHKLNNGFIKMESESNLSLDTNVSEENRFSSDLLLARSLDTTTGAKVVSTGKTGDRLNSVRRNPKSSITQTADVNSEFKMVLDIIRSDDGSVANLAGSNLNAGINEIDNNMLINNKQSHEQNPPYVIDTDMFFNSVTDLDGKSSMAVIISLLAALAAVLVVILIFFFIEVFSRRKYMRNSRIRPSISFY